MSISYKKLWKMLIDRDTKKKDLCTVIGISFLAAPQQNKGGAFSIICSAFYGRRPVETLARLFSAKPPRPRTASSTSPDEKIGSVVKGRGEASGERTGRLCLHLNDFLRSPG